MSYIRIKTINGKDYFYEQESVRIGTKVTTRHVRYIGKFLNVNTAKFVQYHMNETKEKDYNGAELGKFRDSENIIADKRFNLTELKYVGQGRDRIVYETSDGKIVKIAKTPNGLLQNDAETDYYNTLLPKTIEVGKDYVVKEKAVRDDKRSNILLKGLKKFSQRDFDNKDSKMQTEMQRIDEKYDIDMTGTMNYDVGFGDLTASRNWGWIGDTPYHVDGGTFNKTSFDKTKLNDYDKKLWNEIVIERKSS